MAADKSIPVSTFETTIDGSFAYDEEEPTRQQEQAAWLWMKTIEAMETAGFVFVNNAQSVQSLIYDVKVDPVTGLPYEDREISKPFTVVLARDEASLSFRGEPE